MVFVEGPFGGRSLMNGISVFPKETQRGLREKVPSINQKVDLC